MLLACEIIGATTLSLLPSHLTPDNLLLRGCDVLLTTNRLASGLPPNTVSMTADWLADVVTSVVHPTDPAPLDREIPGSTVVRIVRSSGTTASPKAIAMSLAKQQLIVARNAKWIACELASRQNFLGMYHLTIRSIHHSVLACLQHGGTVYFAGEAAALDLIEAGAVNAGTFVVGDVERLVRDARPPPQGHRLLLWAIVAAASRALRQLIQQRLNATFFNFFSSNETGRVRYVNDDNVGTIYPDAAARIIDEDGRDKLPGETGFIIVKTATMVDGYYNDPVLTADRFVDGWFHTRDIGYMPAPDRLVVIGRAGDVLNVGGIKLAPGPIEEQIKTIDGITDTGLLSIDNANGPTSLLVAIETPTGDLPPRFAEQFDPLMARYILSFKLLIARRFPRTDTGKVKRKDLTDSYVRSSIPLPI
jgi:acyl-coenzyme A synthetase/AMP-(fatty) acid ligase